MPKFSDDVIIQAVISGMLVAFAGATLVLAALGVAVAVYFNNVVNHLRDRVTRQVRDEAEKVVRRITANALNRQGYFEWQQSKLGFLSEAERQRSLRTAIDDTERAYRELESAGVPASYVQLMAQIRSNLAWYYAEAKANEKAAEAKEHARKAADRYADFSSATAIEWLFTKAHVLTVFADCRSDVEQALWAYDILVNSFGHLPGVAERVAERRPKAQARLSEFP